MRTISKQEMKNRARMLRKNATLAELNLWYNLRNRSLNGYKFHRQFVIGFYIVDFVCWEKKLVVEIDGGQHADNIKYDEARTAYLNSRGFQVLRFWNDEVLTKTKSVLENILEALETIT